MRCLRGGWLAFAKVRHGGLISLLERCRTVCDTQDNTIPHRKPHSEGSQKEESLYGTPKEERLEGSGDGRQ